jgi:hypothetical protein
MFEFAVGLLVGIDDFTKAAGQALLSPESSPNPQRAE